MTKIDFKAYAEELAREQSRQQMAPVIEKELIHYEILDALDENGVLGQMTFQGGTCLRLCYGALRYSEDLDFAAGGSFDTLHPEKIASVLSSALERRFDVRVRVKAPHDKAGLAGIGVKRWWIIVDTALERPDLPSQHIKLEIADVPSYTRSIKRLSLHYPKLPSSYDTILVPCQSLEEILADKVIAFANSKKSVRYRDLWDIPWIWNRIGQSPRDLPELVATKHRDYQCETPLVEFLREGAARAGQFVRSNEFLLQMRRFIPEDVIERTLERPEYITVMANELLNVYESSMPTA